MPPHRPTSDHPDRRDDSWFVCVGGGPEPLTWPAWLIEQVGDTSTASERPYVIAADRGAQHAFDAGVPVDLVVGDFDSLAGSHVERLSALGVAVERHPTDKAMSDLELAMERARADGAQRLDVVLSGRGRNDHALIAALSLTAPSLRPLTVTGHIDGSTIVPLHDARRVVACDPGDVVTIVPLDDPSTVTVRGVRWPLERAEMQRGTSWGLSNVATDTNVEVEVHSSTILAIITPSDLTAER